MMTTELTEELKNMLVHALAYYKEMELNPVQDHNAPQAERVDMAVEWVEAQEVKRYPVDVRKQPCPYCNRFTTVWRFPRDSGTINIRRCENCYNHFVYFTLHPVHGTQIVTEEEFHNMLHQPGRNQWLNK